MMGEIGRGAQSGGRIPSVGRNFKGRRICYCCGRSTRPLVDVSTFRAHADACKFATNGKASKDHMIAKLIPIRHAERIPWSVEEDDSMRKEQ